MQNQQLVNEPPTSPQHQQYAPQTDRGNAVGFGSSALGSIFGIARDWIADQRNKKSVERAQDFSTKSANEAFQREQASATAARNYNSESSQVRRFVEAGLSPALMYSEMSPSTAQSASASAAQSIAPMASEINKSPGLMEAFELFLQSQGVGSNMALQSAQARNLDSQTRSSNINNETLNARNLQEIQTSIAQMESLLASSSLSKAQRDRIQQMLQKELDLLDEQIGLTSAQQGQATASANLSTAQAGAVPSQIALNFANAKNAKASAEFTAGAQTRQADSQADLNQANRNKSRAETQNMTAGQSVAYEWLTNHGFDESEAEDLAPVVVRMFEQLGTKFVGDLSSSLTSWLDASNILPAINQWRRTKAIERMAENEKFPKDEPKDESFTPDPNDYTKTAEEHRKAAVHYYKQLSPVEQRVFDSYRQDHLKALKSEGYDSQSTYTIDLSWERAFMSYRNHLEHKHEEILRKSHQSHQDWINDWFK